tara:strand:+ start:881 stop:1120 length:240 start_codon:yes stop_codon:yes gene_type:complete
MNHNAIRNTHPTVVTITGDNSFDASGNLVEIDAALVAEEEPKVIAAIESDLAQKAADKQSAHDKLSALGLTDAEIEAIT